MNGAQKSGREPVYRCLRCNYVWEPPAGLRGQNCPGCDACGYTYIKWENHDKTIECEGQKARA